MIDIKRLEPGTNYVFICRSAEDFKEVFESAREYCSMVRSIRKLDEHCENLHVEYSSEGKLGGARISPTFDGRVNVSWCELEFYTSGNFGECEIVEISDFTIQCDFGSWDDSPNLLDLIGSVV